ncbi:hypothetical protein [Flexibacterium corallicola]|uniref:hypothetical protein n=1 Tax=Flexibacterium corallicola TaxID=3037259 RepID=UPI00286F4F41|nr:hypothetical protein [Pseudovibrio sp. M1P-2-3]
MKFTNKQMVKYSTHESVQSAVDLCRYQEELRELLVEAFPALEPMVGELVRACRYERVPRDWQVSGSGYVSHELLFVVRGRVGVFDRQSPLQSKLIRQVPQGGLVGSTSYLLANEEQETSTQILNMTITGVIALIPWDRHGSLPISAEANALFFKVMLEESAKRDHEQLGYLKGEFLLLTQRMWSMGVLAVLLLEAVSILTIYSVSREFFPRLFTHPTLLPLWGSLAVLLLFFVQVRFMLKAMQIPRPQLGIQTKSIDKQVLWGALISLPLLVVMIALRDLLEPAFDSPELHFRKTELSLRHFFASLSNREFFCYLLFLVPLQQFVVRCGVQIPVVYALGSRWVYAAPIANIASAASFAAFYLFFGWKIVLLGFVFSIYWGIIFFFRRSLITILTSHWLLAGAAFTWFGFLKVG